MAVLAPPESEISFAVWVFVQQADALLSVWPEAHVTSWWRNPAHNARVGGVPTSRHLTGTAIDVVISRPLVPAFMGDVQWIGLHPLDEGDHIHIQDVPLRRR